VTNASVCVGVCNWRSKRGSLDVSPGRRGGNGNKKHQTMNNSNKKNPYEAQSFGFHYQIDLNGTLLLQDFLQLNLCMPII
jgi:hypothetical protein